VDENGTLLKTVNLKTKRGEDDLGFVSIYGYNIIGFESDQGLWETAN
jgi:hypothetical protein